MGLRTFHRLHKKGRSQTSSPMTITHPKHSRMGGKVTSALKCTLAQTESRARAAFSIAAAIRCSMYRRAQSCLAELGSLLLAIATATPLKMISWCQLSAGLSTGQPGRISPQTWRRMRQTGSCLETEVRARLTWTSIALDNRGIIGLHGSRSFSPKRCRMAARTEWVSTGMIVRTKARRCYLEKGFAKTEPQY